MDEDFYKIITLKCSDCENTYCSAMPCGRYVVEEQGCKRKVDEDTYIEYENLYKEQFPFYSQLPSKKSQDMLYKDLMDVFEKIFKCPIVHIVGKSGKVVTTGITDKKLKEWNESVQSDD